MIAAPSWPARAWSLLTAVPGRPEASRLARGRRAAPLLLPALVLLSLAAWKWGVLEPRVRAERAANQPLLNLAREVSALRSRPSPAGSPEAAQAAILRAALPAGRAGLPAFLRQEGARAAAQGWEAGFGPLADLPAEPGAPLGFVTVGGLFRPVSGNLRPWSSLLGLLDDFSGPNSRIGVTRLAIRADEQGRYSVEMRLNLPYLAETPAYVE